MGILRGWRYCPRCRGELSRAAGRADCEACGFVAWANPVPGAQALLEEDGRVLLGRRSHDPSAGLWDIPGGFLDENEHPLDALRREFREETGLDIEPVEFLGSWMQPYTGRTVLCLTWLARRSGGELRTGDELVELRWFGADDLPAPGRARVRDLRRDLSLWRARHEHA